MKKFICLVMTFICLFTVTSYAGTTFKDVDKKYQEAVDMLVSFEIVNGFEDNTFRPKESVTRAQFAKMLVISMGVSEDDVTAAKKKYLDFSDVLSSHWAYGYIKVATDMKLINGYEDGTFKPDKTVTYAEATTMLLRALEYEDALDKTLTWPNNYMSYANNKLNLFRNVGDIKASNAAPRGDVAILLWNSLRTGISKIVGENNKGLIYGEGTPMITKYMNYVYVKDAELISIVFSDDYETAKVTLQEEKKDKVKVDIRAGEALNMFGKTITALIDIKSGKIIESSYDTDLKLIAGEITNITKTKIYIASRSSGYSIPEEKDNILLYGINDLSEAVEIEMLVDGSSAIYCVAKGATDAVPGIVVNNSVSISENGTGIRVRKLDATKGGDDYYVVNEALWPNKNAVILYYINSDDMLFVISEIKQKYAASIGEVGKNYIEVDGDEYKFNSEDDYTVVFVSSSSLKEKSLKDIEPTNDLAIVINYATKNYIFVYEDAVLDTLDKEMADALKDLSYMIEEALEDYDEIDYTQESYANLMAKVKYGSLLDHTYKVKKIQNATIAIEDAIKELDDSVSKSELKIVTAKKKLRNYCGDECADVIYDEDKYTVKSYDSFYNYYKDAEKILDMTDASLSAVQNAYDNLVDAVDSLVLKK